MIINKDRLVFFDTETTGLDNKVDRIIEIGGVESIAGELTGNNLHMYFNPGRSVSKEAQDVHGLDSHFLASKPTIKACFEEIIEYFTGCVLVAHNASFDVGFMNSELRRCGYKIQLADICVVEDTLKIARKMYPGKRNSLDALCQRLGVDKSQRLLHGALLDSELLAKVYYAMMTDQGKIDGLVSRENNSGIGDEFVRDVKDQALVFACSSDDGKLHEKWLEQLTDEEKKCWG